MEINLCFFAVCLLLLTIRECTAADPCRFYTTLDDENEATRSVAYNVDSTLCDNTLTSGWYRVTSKAGERMPTQCILGGFRCGTSSPIWLKGSYPPTYEVEDGTACASSFDGNCCAYSYNIQIKNCSDYLVYYLVPTMPCYQAYCFGDKLPCAEGQTSPNGLSPGCEDDHCHSKNYKILHGEKQRSSNYTLQPGDIAIEDSRLKTGWYRIESVSGNDIVNESQPLMQCGTVFPLWMNGSIPVTVNRTVERVVCTTGPTSKCEQQLTIKVRNCGSYRTYYLLQLNVDKSAYCFGSLVIDSPSKSTTTIHTSPRPTSPFNNTTSAKRETTGTYTDKDNITHEDELPRYIFIIIGILSVGFLVLLVIVVALMRRRKADSNETATKTANDKDKEISAQLNKECSHQLQENYYSDINLFCHQPTDTNDYEQIRKKNQSEDNHTYAELGRGCNSLPLINLSNNQPDTKHYETFRRVNPSRDIHTYASLKRDHENPINNELVSDIKGD